MRKILLLLMAIIMIAVINPASCETSKDVGEIVVEVVKEKEWDVDDWTFLYVMKFTDPDKVFESDDGRSLKTVFGLLNVQVPKSGMIQITEHEDKLDSCMFLFDDDNNLIGATRLIELLDITTSAGYIITDSLKSGMYDSDTYSPAIHLLAAYAGRASAALELFFYAQEHAIQFGKNKVQNNQWYIFDN